MFYLLLPAFLRNKFHFAGLQTSIKYWDQKGDCLYVLIMIPQTTSHQSSGLELKDLEKTNGLLIQQWILFFLYLVSGPENMSSSVMTPLVMLRKVKINNPQQYNPFSVPLSLFIHIYIYKYTHRHICDYILKEAEEQFYWAQYPRHDTNLYLMVRHQF